MKHLSEVLLICALLVGCATMQDPLLLKYESYATQVDGQLARGELSQMEADNLKLQAFQSYQEQKRREERELLDQSYSNQVKSQNLDILRVPN